MITFGGNEKTEEKVSMTYFEILSWQRGTEANHEKSHVV